MSHDSSATAHQAQVDSTKGYAQPATPTPSSSAVMISGATLPVHSAPASLPHDVPNSGPLLDQWGRTATDLRISLTDKCNLRCQYCMPAEGMEWLPQSNLLSAAEVRRLVNIAVHHMGIEEVRFTGGEPLLRKDLAEIIGSVHADHPRLPISITTNGLGLDKHAEKLVAAGLERINVSLDSICPETFAELTRRDRLHDVLQGIDAAARAGLSPIKINAVLMPGVNDDQAVELLQWALREGYQLRFIEQMPLDADQQWSKERTITAAQIREQLEGSFVLHQEPGPRGSAPAALWDVYPLGTESLDSAHKLGTVGIIASVTEPFCHTCTRTRLTADGKIRSCLFSAVETDVMALLRSDASDEDIALRWREAMWAKPVAHGKNSAGFDTTDFIRPTRSMSAIGG